MNFKRCSTVAALLMASAIPAVAQEAEANANVELVLPPGVFQPELVVPGTVQVPADSILLNIQGTQTVYAVPYATAADLCEVEEADLVNLVAQGVNLIYCEELEEAILTGTEGAMPIEGNFEEPDDDDDDGDFSDDAQETAVDEAADQADGEDDDSNELFDEDDDDMDEDDGLIDNDDADPNDDDMDSGDNTDGGDTDGGDDTNMDDDVTNDSN